MDGRNLHRKFLRAAEARQAAADFLFRAGFNNDAVHLAGIAAECAIKSLVLSYVPVRQRQKFDESNFRGARAHRFEYLRAIMQKQGCQFPDALQRHWRRLTTWSIDLPYETTNIPTDDAARMLKASVAAIVLAKGRI